MSIYRIAKRGKLKTTYDWMAGQHQNYHRLAPLISFFYLDFPSRDSRRRRLTVAGNCKWVRRDSSLTSEYKPAFTKAIALLTYLIVTGLSQD